MRALEQDVAEPERQAYSYRNLDLWRRAQELALGVIKMSESLPKSEAARSIARQVVPSSGSVAANIAEGHGRYSVAAYRNHLSIARGSVTETDSWLDLLARAGYVTPDIARQLHDECELLLGGLTRQMRALEARLRSQPKTLREEEPSYMLEGLPE
jgi:four helix bundle protein